MDILQGGLSITNRSWHLIDIDSAKILQYVQKYSLPVIVAKILLARGIKEENIVNFINSNIKNSLPNPHNLKDMDKGIKRVINAIKTQEKIAVFGDYDVDGATSAALLKKFFSCIGIEVLIYIPDRIKEGYGASIESVNYLFEKGVKLMITVDCGTTSFEALEHAHNIGLDVIVIDHHIGLTNVPKAVAIINPNRADETKDNASQMCAAVGVTFLFLVALQATIKKQELCSDYQLPNLLNFLDIVATGTVCDVVPLKGINRAYVKQGLKVFMQNNNLGLQTLSSMAGITDNISTYHLGFIIGPRINAGGRVGQANLGSKLLTTQDEYLAKQIATQLNIYNDERKTIESNILEQASIQAETQKNSCCIIIAGDNWHAGVIGIIAGRIKDKFYRPTFVISFDEQGIGKGSGRSITDLDIGNLIHQAQEQAILINGGGHAMAGGLTIAKDKLQNFKDFVQAYVSQLRLSYVPIIKIDAQLFLAEISIKLIEDLDLLGPHGQGNAAPKFLLRKVKITQTKIVGKEHIRCFITDLQGNRPLNAMFFRAVNTKAGEAILDHNNELFNIIGNLTINKWNNVQKPQLIITDLMQDSASC